MEKKDLMIRVNTREAARIEDLLWAVLRAHNGWGLPKTSASIVEPAIAETLSREGYTVDLHDTRGFYPTGVPPWRLGDNSLESATRRFIDVVVYDSSRTARGTD